MLKVDRILAPTDLTEVSRIGVQYALELAHALRAEVICLNVVPYEEGMPDPVGVGEFSATYLPSEDYDERLNTHREMLERFMRDHFSELSRDLTISLDVDVGDPDEATLEKAADAEVDLIVMATHGRSGLEHVLLGSVTEHVIRKANCPVLSVRAHREEPA